MVPSLIQIQIATVLTEDDVGDIRWVLLDPSDAGPSVVSAAIPIVAGNPACPATPVRSVPSILTQAANDAPPGRQAAWTYQVLRAVVLAVALLGAWWVASMVLAQRSGSGTAVSPVPPATSATRR
jgi:hypothetical protein